MTKRIFSMLLLVCMVFSIAACGDTHGTGSSDPASGSINSGESSATGASGETAAPVDTTDPETSGTENKTTTSGRSSSTTPSIGPTAPQPTGQSSVELAGPVNIPVGSVPMDQSLNFGGKTFTMAITGEPQYQTGQFKRMVAAFETKYKCKIQPATLVFETYNQQVTQAMSSGKPYDIAYAHGSMFPGNVISGLAEDMSKTITTADYMSESNPAAGGIDIYKSSYFAWKGGLYGLCTYSADSVYPYLIYYNKQLFKNNGLEDPLELYNAGKWTWTKIRTMGRQVTDTTKDVYFISVSFVSFGSINAYGKPISSIEKGAPVEYLSSANVMSSLSMLQNFFTSSSPIGDATENRHTTRMAKFVSGTRFMYMEESMKYPEIADSIMKSNAFGRNKNNLGIVPVPLDSGNKDKAYPTGWLFAVYAGKGSSDPRAAVAWAKFRQSYQDPVTDANAMSADQKKLVNQLLSGKIAFQHGVYATSSYNTLQLFYELTDSCLTSMDLSSVISSIRAQYQAAIKATVG